MRSPAASPLLEQILRETPHRYRLPALPVLHGLPLLPDDTGTASPATVLALVIEQVRSALAREETPDSRLKPVFVDALAALIREAMDAQGGDAAFQAMALRHQAAPVREYARLSGHRKQDVRQLRAHIDAIAHPARLKRLSTGLLRDMLAKLHASAGAAAWADAANLAQHVSTLPEARQQPMLESRLTEFLQAPALQRLMRLDELEADEQVRRYRVLLDSNGPASGSPDAARQGAASRRRGAEVEALATRAIEALAQRLNEDEPAGGARYRVVTSLRVPAALPGSPERAKTEWDVVLLSQASGAQDDAWDICLLVEAKAAVDAAGTDLPRLLRGLRLLAQADPHKTYSFQARHGEVGLHGASLSALPTEAGSLASTVLYCCDAPADTTTRLLSTASRMQLLSAPESLTFATALQQCATAEIGQLEPLWHQLMESPRWNALLQQLASMRQARELMMHPDDLSATVCLI